MRPGTDAALALGMMKVIIEEDLYDHEFVDNWCYGFDELAERAKEFDVKRVSEITWVPEEKIIARRPHAGQREATPRCSGAWPLT